MVALFEELRIDIKKALHPKIITVEIDYISI
jgi:hypothetical protein